MAVVRDSIQDSDLRLDTIANFGLDNVNDVGFCILDDEMVFPIRRCLTGAICVDHHGTQFDCIHSFHAVVFPFAVDNEIRTCKIDESVSIEFSGIPL